MCDQATEREFLSRDRSTDPVKVSACPFSGYPKACLAHEGRGEGEGNPFPIEARENDLATWREARNEFVEDGGVTARVVDSAIVAAWVFARIEYEIAVGAVTPRRIRFPDGWRLVAA